MTEKSKKKWCNDIIARNKYLSRWREYKMLPRVAHRRNRYCNANIGGIDNICTVKVLNKNSFDIMDVLVTNKGVKNYGQQPKILNVHDIGKKFIGNPIEKLEGVRDVKFLLRTNFSGIHNPNSINNLRDSECIYFPSLSTIRYMNYSWVPYNDLYMFSLLLVQPINEPQLLKDGNMCINDYKETIKIIETIFQTAIFCDDKILIIPPIGVNKYDKNPVDDIIKILNYCILKYGHKFQSIIISIPPDSTNKEIFEKFRNDIVCPNQITSIIDQKYESKKMHFKLENLKTIENIRKMKVKKKERNPDEEPEPNLKIDMTQKVQFSEGLDNLM